MTSAHRGEIDCLSNPGTLSSFPNQPRQQVDADTRKAICVNLTTLRNHSDTTCVLKRGDHPFVVHDSVINFSDAQEMPIDKVEQALAAKTDHFVCKLLDPCDARLLARIRQGLLDSSLTPKGIKSQCKRS